MSKLSNLFKVVIPLIIIYLSIGLFIWLLSFVQEYQELESGRDGLLVKYDFCEKHNYSGFLVTYGGNFSQGYVNPDVILLGRYSLYAKAEHCGEYNRINGVEYSYVMNNQNAWCEVISTISAEDVYGKPYTRYIQRCNEVTKDKCVWTSQGADVGKGNICGDYEFWINYSPFKDTFIIELKRIWIIFGWPLLILYYWALSDLMH